MTLLELLMLAELISARRILKTKLLEFLGLPDNCQDKTDYLVSKIVSVLEVNPAEQERFWETIKSKLAVDPVELEAILKCSPAQRQQWIEQGKLPILEYRSFRKSGIHLEYPVHDRRFILSLTETDINNWRKEPKGLIPNHRPTASPINTENRAENEQSRGAFSSAWEKIIADWKEQGSAEISATFQLAYWTVWASRWAKENQLNSSKAIKYKEVYETHQQE